MDEIEVGVNESEPAEQTEVSENTEVTEVEEAEGNTEGTESEVAEEKPELDRNAIYADARRKAEAESRRKYSAIDAQYAEKFKDYKNPITGQPIKSAQDYFDALAAQEQLATKKTLADKGLDPELIEKAVNNSPAIKAANLVIQQQRIEEVKNYLEKQVEEIGKIDPDIKSAKDIESSERYPEILKYVNDNRLSVVDAYKLVYADKLVSKKTAAVKQQTLNNVKSQQHLTPTDGVSNSDELKEIPASLREQYEMWFPDKTPKQRKELYNASLH